MGLIMIMNMRKKQIIAKFSALNAISEENAISLEEAKISSPNLFGIIDKLVKQGILIKTKNNKYYLNK